jgi:hypothetical protein
MEREISVILITSPSISNPDTSLIDTTLEGLSHLSGLETVTVYILLDGYSIHPIAQTKKGRITAAMEQKYELYHQRLMEKYTPTSPSISSEMTSPAPSNRNYQIVKCDQHYGFALAVKYGLELCQTPYALILQHDRTFTTPFPYLNNLLLSFQLHPNIRYIGFPTIASMNHCRVLRCRYGLLPLVQHSSSRLLLPQHPTSSSDSPPSTSYEIQPTIFWYDSNHLCHVQRYLEIYTPFLSLPSDLREELQQVDRQIVSKLLLRRGDFIEDRFGQAQRNILASLKEKPELLLRAHQWFGSYLLYSLNMTGEGEQGEREVRDCEETGQEIGFEEKEKEEEELESEREQMRSSSKAQCLNPFLFSSARIMVSHLRGRHYDPHHVAWPESRSKQVEMGLGGDQSPCRHEETFDSEVEKT